MKNYRIFILLVLFTTVISFAVLAKSNQPTTLPCPAGSFVKTIYASVKGGV